MSRGGANRNSRAEDEEDPERQPRIRIVARADNTRWSRCGAPWLQPVAISGKSTGRRNGENERKPLPSVATARLRALMVRRGSTVRVRQRALQKPCKARLFLSKEVARAPVCGGYGAVYGAFRSRSRL